MLFELPRKNCCLRIIDLRMAPGGFSMTSRKRLPNTTIDASTLPTEIGGYPVMSREIFSEIVYPDITIYAQEMELDETNQILTSHPDSTRFETTRPYIQNQYDIISCGGAVGKGHPRETIEAHTVCLVHAFSQFSEVQIYKHPKIHAMKSSFYLVARNIDLEHETAKESLRYWKSLARYLTFRQFADNILPPSSRLYDLENGFACYIRDEFGARFTELACHVWEIQRNALRRSGFTTSS
ncbi:hypothetical protein BJX64DRAFT_281241 [Aspergillus heterothallicus]